MVRNYTYQQYVQEFDSVVGDLVSKGTLQPFPGSHQFASAYWAAGIPVSQGVSYLVEMYNQILENRLLKEMKPLQMGTQYVH